MEDEIPPLLLSAAFLGGVACISSIALSVQRRFYHDTIQFGKDPSPLKFDHVRDYRTPFADDTRLTRTLFGSIIMSALSAFDMYQVVVQHSSDKSTLYISMILSAALVLIARLYILAITVVSTKYKLPNQWGFNLNIHLFILYMTSLFVSFYRLWDAFRVYHNQLTLAQGLPLILQILISLDLFYTTGTIRQGPPYLEVGLNDETTPVAEITVASIFEFLMFSWATPMVDAVYRNARDVSLPSLPSEYRAYNLFYIFGQNRDKTLIRRLIYANKTALLLQSILTGVSAGLYYGPAFFLNKFLNLIQQIDMGKEDEFYIAEGFVIISGLSLAIMLLSVVVGQLYYWSKVLVNVVIRVCVSNHFCFVGSSSLRVRVKSMLNIELYRKTLRRMDTVDMAASSPSEEVEEPTNATTGTIVNLMSTDSQRISDFTTSWFTIIEAPIELAVGITFLYSLLGKSCILGLSVMIITLPLNHYNSIFFAKTQEKLMEARDRRVSLMNEVLQGIRQIKFFAWEMNWEKRVLDSRDDELVHLKKIYLSEVLFNFLWQG